MGQLMGRARRGSLAAVLSLPVALSLGGCGGQEPSGQQPVPVSEQAADRAEDMAACMQEKGWEATFNRSDGSMEVGGVPQDQRAVQQADHAECYAEMPVLEVEYDEETAGAYYDALVEAADCLAALGFQAGERPSREASVESLLSDAHDPLWYPYEELIASASASEAEAAIEACPEPSFGG